MKRNEIQIGQRIRINRDAAVFQAGERGTIVEISTAKSANIVVKTDDIGFGPEVVYLRADELETI